jgi:hypothetical protein
MARRCNVIIVILTPGCQLQGDHRAVSLILPVIPRSHKMIDMPGTPTLAPLLLGHTKVSIPPACQHVSLSSSCLTELTYLPLQSSKRVFILGPSHHVYLDGCALSKCKEYATPLGPLPLDHSSMHLTAPFSSGSYQLWQRSTN